MAVKDERLLRDVVVPVTESLRFERVGQIKSMDQSEVGLFLWLAGETVADATTKRRALASADAAGDQMRTGVFVAQVGANGSVLVPKGESLPSSVVARDWLWVEA